MTLERLYPTVKLHMSGIIRHVVKRCATLLALPDFLARVGTPMCRQFTTIRERVSADVTLVRSLARVDTMMKGQPTRMIERLAADITAVRSLSLSDLCGYVVDTPVY